jgi:AcrR family transcriptional regulator
MNDMFIIKTTELKEEMMPQVLKESVKEQISDAAEHLFAKLGYKQATMGLIAKEAGVATGNIYKYFTSKDALFYSIITPGFVKAFKDLTRKRVDILIQPDGLAKSQSMIDGEAGKLLRFWIKNRFKVIIVLSRAQGSIYESFAQDYIQAMIEQSMEQLFISLPGFKKTDVFLFTFKNRLADTVRDIVSILETYETEAQISEAFVVGWAYHHAGIQGLINLQTQK